MSNLVLSPKFKKFLSIKSKRDYLEGTTAAGKTTVGIPKFMLMVAMSDKKDHVIAGADLGTVEKNIINSELGLLSQFKYVAEYYSNGKGKISIPHIEYKTVKGTKIIYVCGYDNKKRWQKVLGSQMGCVFIDEINIADMEFVREVTHRCEYMITTNNPDDPSLDVYKEFINKSRPLKEYIKDYPKELLEELKEPYVKGWIHWYFTFYDNASLTEEDIQEKINAVPVGTKMYKNKIQGIRGKATGLVFNIEKKDIITEEQAKAFNYIRFSIGCDTSYSSKTHDELTFLFIGITDDRRCVLLEEEGYNNKDIENPFAPSDVIIKLINFAEKCKIKWGFAPNIFIDSADAGTIAEANKYKREYGCIYNFIGAWKKTPNLTRIQLTQSWLKTNDFLIVETCTGYLKECDRYSYTEKVCRTGGLANQCYSIRDAWRDTRFY